MSCGCLRGSSRQKEGLIQHFNRLSSHPPPPSSSPHPSGLNSPYSGEPRKAASIVRTFRCCRRSTQAQEGPEERTFHGGRGTGAWGRGLLFPGEAALHPRASLTPSIRETRSPGQNCGEISKFGRGSPPSLPTTLMALGWFIFPFSILIVRVGFRLYTSHGHTMGPCPPFPPLLSPNYSLSSFLARSIPIHRHTLIRIMPHVETLISHRTPRPSSLTPPTQSPPY